MTMMRFILILLLICSLVARTQQQPEEEEEEIFTTQCEGSTCLECADNGCGWVSLGGCVIDCSYIADIACYSNETVPNAQTSADVCNAYERYLNDTRICNEARTDCSTCVATLQSDGTSPCQWYPITQSCWTGACNQLGCGTTTCPVGGDDNDGGGSFLSCSSSGASTCPECLALEDDCVWNSLTNTCVINNGTLSDSAFSTTCNDDVLGNETTGAPAGTPAPSTTTSIGGGNAGAIASCEECLEQGYAWAIGECLTSCSVIADAPCYSTQYFDNKTAAEICEIERDNTADTNLCQLQTDCVSCTNTTKSDGFSNCAWYVDGTLSWCGTGGCNMFGVCGSLDCMALDDVTPSQPPSTMMSDDVTPSQPPSTSNMYCSSAPNATTCEECVEADCAWTIGACWNSCSVIADASCYSKEYFGNNTSAGICEIERNSTTDTSLCEQQMDCVSCTNTTKSDGSSKCGWYVDGENSWCGTGDCNMWGICGSSNCSSLSLSQPPATTSSSFHMFAMEQTFSLILCCVALIL